MQFRIKQIYYIITLIILYLAGCTSPINWTEFTFTKNKPEKIDLIGNWSPTKKTLNDMKDRGGYNISKHEINLKADGGFKMVNMPDWWIDGFGESKKMFQSGSGNWKIEKDGKFWIIGLHFRIFSGKEKGFWTPVFLRRQKPPYQLYFTLGDPDTERGMIFEKA